ncbi:MAG: hypothetical protein R2911_40310 [Caldilineaceae bacterium]
MKKRSSTIEWHYLDSASGEEAWAQYMAGEPSAPAALSRNRAESGWIYDGQVRRILLPLALVLCVAAAGASYWLWQSAQSGLAKIRQEIQLAAMSELGDCVETVMAASQTPRLDVQATNEPRRAAAPLSAFCLPWRQAMADYVRQAAMRPDQRLNLQMVVEDVELDEPFALVNVRLTTMEVGATTGYRTSLLFEQTAAGWQYGNGAPTTLWGAPRGIGSALLRVDFHERDAAELTPIVERLTQQYAAWRAAFGLPEAPPQPIVLEAATAFQEPHEEFWANPPHALVIPSPLLLVRADDQPAGGEFEQRASRFLQLHVIAEAMRTPAFLENRSLPDHWQIMIDGFFFALERTSPAVEPHKQVQALDLPLALITFGPETTQTVFTNANNHDSERGWIVFSRPSLNYPGKYWAAESVAEYILQNYPPEQIAAMLRVLPRHESWETLAPDVFGMDAPTFQTRWREYVAARYPLE